MTQRLYTEMSADEQALWVQDFAQVLEQCGERLALLTKGKATATTDDAAAIRRIFSLLAAWPFAQDFCEKAQRYGDYMARTSRLPIYIEKVKEKLADGLTMTDTNGRIVAYVNPSTPLRRRGRPTKEEVAARLRGETITMQGGDNPEARKRRTIAKMLGLEVVIHGDAPREKNNAELAAEKAAKQREYERMNPSLFAAQPGGSSGTGSMRAVEDGTLVPVPSDSPAPQSGNPAASSASGVPSVAVPQQPQCPTMSEIYNDRIEQDRLRLSDLAWLCSDGLRERIPTVQALRVTAESASERAKTMADLGQPADAIAPYAQQAKDAVEGYQAIYAAVDEELAILHKRLYLDAPFLENFKRRFRGVDVEKVLHITRPYYEKVKKDDPAIDARVKLAIERDNPEYAAKLAKEQAEKEELQALHRYIMRKDKDPSDERCRTLEKRIARIRELAGDAVADTYLPVLEKTRADNLAWRAAKGKSAVPNASVAPKERKKSSSKKSAKKD